MPYTRVWSDATPAGSRAANEIDDAIREFKVDVRERMNSFIVDWLADPVVLQAAFGGAKTGKRLVFGPFGGSPTLDEDDLSWTDEYMQMDNTAGRDHRVPIILPTGITITLVQFIVDRNSGINVTVQLRSRTFDTVSTSASAASATTAAAGIQVIDSGVVSILTDDATSWNVKVVHPGGGARPRYYGCRVTYNSPGSGSAI